MTALFDFAFEKRLSADDMQKKMEILARAGYKGEGRLASFDAVLETISKAYLNIDRRAAEGIKAVGASLWLYENYPLFEETVLNVRRSLRKKSAFPLVRRGEYAGVPRGVALAFLMLRHGDCEISAEKLKAALESFMKIAPLSQKELWQIPAFFHYALGCLCAVISKDIDAFETARERAEGWHENLLSGKALLSDPKLKALLKQEAFLEHLIAVSRDGSSALPSHIEAMAEESGISVAESVDKAHETQSLLQIRIANCAASIRAISSMDWIGVFESVNPLGKILSKEKAGVFVRNDFESRQTLFRQVSLLAQRSDMEEIEVAEAALDMADEKGTYVSAVLLGRHLKALKKALGIGGWQFKGGKWLFMAGVLLLNVAAYYSVFLLFGFIAAVLLSVPIASLSIWLVAAVFTRIVKPRRLLRYDLKAGIPQDLRTIVVISCLITGAESIIEQGKKMERLYIANRDPGGNLLIALLSDFPDAPLARMAEDGEMLRIEEDMINSLNRKYSTDSFCCFHRAREATPEGRYMGKERKRGAITAVNSFLLAGEGDFLLKIFPEDLVGNVKYAVALDSDTKAKPGAINEMVGILAHPFNGKYAIVAPRIATPLDSIGTRLQRVISADAGMAAYSGICSDLYQDLAEEGIYCGKGIYDIKKFDAALQGKIPDNTVLSHDLLESLYARCAYASDIIFFDGGPASAASFYKRQHRWARGDFQLIPWLLTRRGKGLSALSRWKIWDNIRRWMLPAFVTAALIYLCARGYWLLAYAVILAYLLTACWDSFLYAAAMLPKDAWTSLSAFFTTLWRMLISKRNMLQWTTAAQAERLSASKGLASVIGMLPNIICTGLLVLAGVLSPVPWGLLFALPVGLLWLFGIFLAEKSSEKLQDMPPFSDEQRKTLIRIARKTYSWFEQVLDERGNFLPPDNVQILPYRGAVERTSPTNVGYALCAHISAYELGFIDSAMLLERLERTIQTMERMPKWNGHLYNWHDLKSLEPLPPKYVSSVDSGNLAASLMLCSKTLRDAIDEPFDFIKIKEGCILAIKMDGEESAEVLALLEAVKRSENAEMLMAALGLISAMRKPGRRTLALKGMRFSPNAPVAQMESLAGRIDDLIANMDFSKLYDEQKKLFYIGYDAQSEAYSKAHYDLLASESRLASFVAIAKGNVPHEHYSALGRPLTALDEGNALLSWSGTMFEYIMPRLFLREDSRSLAGASCKTAAKTQRRNSGGGLWGESESGYYAFDLDLHYQYKAFGEESLSLKGMPDKEHVVAPYAALLALTIMGSDAMDNIDAMSKRGLEGENGMFEAIDFTEGEEGNIVRSYMAHHQGMGLMAIEQAILGKSAQRFMDIPEIGAYLLLLDEAMPGYVKKRVRVTARKQIGGQRHHAFRRRPKENALDIHMISGAGTTLFAYRGGNYSMVGNALLSRIRSGNFHSGIHVFVKGRGETICPTINGDVEFTSESAVYTAGDGEISSEVKMSVSPESGAVVVGVQVKNLSAFEREVEVSCYFEPSLQQPGADAAHPAFSDLFIDVSEYEESLLIRRRDRDGEGDGYAFFSSAGGDYAGFFSSREEFIGRGRDLESAIGHLKPAKGHSGPQITPCAYLRRSIVIKSDGEGEISFAAGKAESGSQSLALAREHSDKDAVQRAISMAGMKAQVLSEYLSITKGKLQTWEMLAAVLHWPERSARESLPKSDQPARDAIWRCGISGDIPIITAFIEDIPQLDLVKELLEAKEYFAIKGFKTDLAFVNCYGSDYLRPVGAGIDQLVRGSSFWDKIGAPAGIHILDASLYSAEDMDSVRACSSAVFYGKKGHLAPQVAQIAQLRDFDPFDMTAPDDDKFAETSLQIPPYLIKSGAGGFLEDGSYGVLLKEGEATPMPYSNIFSNENFGALVTERGGGYTWAENSRELKLTPWRNDAVSDMPSEHVYIRDDETGRVCSLFGAFGVKECFVRHGQGYSVFETAWQGLLMSLTVFVDAEKSIKCFLVEAKNMSGRHRAFSVTAYASWALGANRRSTAQLISTRFSQSSAYSENRNRPGEYAFLSAPMGKILGFTCDETEFMGKREEGVPDGLRRRHLSGKTGRTDSCAAISVAMPISQGGQARLHFLLGYTGDISSNDDAVIEYLPEKSLGAVKRLWRERLSAVQIDTPNRELNVLVNHWLPYQSWSARLLGRTGFYQAGGAYGFRDQLQDVVCLLPYDPSLARNHILLSCRHQFTEGDVQHWWHPERSGVRTLITDDLLFLPWAVCEYVKATGDISIMDFEEPYLEPLPIPEGKHDLYYEPNETALKESVYMHCKRAIDRACRFGEHGLALMGGGDWNDGMNLVGVKGRGESVWLSWFLIHVLERFASLCERYGRPQDECDEYLAKAKRLGSAVEMGGWDGRWYRRAYFDDGTPMGAKDNPECEIDLIAQSWSAFAGKNEGRIDKAIESAYEMLFDKKAGIVKLLAPPFEHSSPSPGYIQGYTPGVRENGGQYSHGAAWFLLALCKTGQMERGLEVLKALLPTSHNDSKEKMLTYKAEPYVMAADVYSGRYEGRAGWTWYTGAAGWLLKAILEGILGVEIKEGDAVIAPPDVDWDSFNVNVRGRRYFCLKQNGRWVIEKDS